MTGRKIRVLVVDDSELFLEGLVATLESDPDIHVVGQARNGNEAVELDAALIPDVITMDVIMPGLDGLDASRTILARRAVPIILLTTLARTDEQRMALNAMRLGVLDVANKPTLAGDELDEAARGVIRLVKSAARVEVSDSQVHRTRLTRGQIPSDRFEIVVVAASTGGPPAIENLLSALPDDHPPVVVAQHLAETFYQSFAGWLAATVGRPVIARASTGLVPGTIYVAGENANLIVPRKGLLECRTPSRGQIAPSANLLFESVARSYGKRAVGIVLTGMGKDGADGLLKLRKTGAWTIAQDRASCAVFGMPRAAMKADACSEILPLKQITERLYELLTGRGATKQ